jgi:SAM-dependent methyltransferase
MKKYLRKYQRKISGEILDVGCGNKPYKNIFENIDSYKGTNSNSYYENSFFNPSEEDYIVEDGTSLPFSSEVFDNVLNFQVLPVFEDPNDFFTEVKRVLKPKGYFLLTVDFLYPIWNAPNNFWRTTKYGLEKLAKKNDFDIIGLEAFGGYWVMQARLLERYLRSMLPQLISRASTERNILLKLLKYLRLFFWLIIVILAPLFVNLAFIVFHLLDKILMDEEFTTNYLVLMQKK